MSRYLNFFFFFSLVLLLQACASYQTAYVRSLKGWEQVYVPTSDSVTHRVFLIGDAGYSPGKPAPALRSLKAALDTASAEGTVVFLGDNIYPKGLPEVTHPDREEAERNILAQLNTVKDYPGKVFFIPGNHDWYAEDGPEGVERQEDFVQDYLDRGDTFVPDNGCGDFEDEDLTEDIVLILVDSKWFLLDWDKHPEINEKCEFKTREDFILALTDEIKKARRKHVILALHHPIYTYGPHGGYFGVKDHLFPLTVLNDNLWIPMPGFGTLVAMLRVGIGIPEDIRDLKYRKFRQEILALTKDYTNVIFASGHEHNLQYIKKDGQNFIVSGSGAKKTRVALAGSALYKAGKYGYSRLDYHKDGSVWMYMYEVDDQVNTHLALRTKIADCLPPELSQEELSTLVDSDELKLDETRAAVLPPQKDRNGFYETLWGVHYRDMYDDSVRVRVLDLSEEKGGLIPIKRGGGFQTNSLRLEDSTGRQWVLRAIKKDAGRILPKAFQKTFANNLVKDQFTASHPYAAFVIAPMAEAVDIYHTNPELVYVPHQKALGNFNIGFGDALYLFEERADEDKWEDSENFGYSDQIVSTSDALELMYDDHENQVDHAFTVRSRLFDMLIGDWDRHDDQWRWAVIDGDGEDQKLLRPIPRDRDQAFSKFDGVFPRLLNRTLPVLRQMQVYDDNFDRIPFMNHNARWFDRTFLSEANMDDFVREARNIQRNLTDELIDAALARWPQEVFESSGEEIAQKLKGRRNELINAAVAYYRFLAREVDVTGTNDDELFEVERLVEGDTRVSVYARSKKGKKKQLIYQRTFYKNETREIRLYGLDGDDEFVVKGDAKKGILVRLIGGTDGDQFVDESSVSGLSRKTKVYDYIEENKLFGGSETADRRSRSKFLNLYNRKAYKYDYGLVFPLAGANPDDGLFLGFNWTFFSHGWKKKPYGSRHKIAATYAFETGASDFRYVGDYLFTGSKWGTELTASYQGPKYVINYFGSGNESTDPFSDDDLDFNRVRQNVILLQPLLKRHFSTDASFTVGPFVEGVRVERTSDRFVADAGLPEEVFEQQWFVGGKARLEYTNLDSRIYPRSGLRFFTEMGYRTNVELEDRDFWRLQSDVRIYMNLGGEGNVVLATRIGGTITSGNPFFYHQATLGDLQNLRGYRRQRFTADDAFYQNTDLRIKLGNLRNYFLPIEIGIYGGFDYGRVWQDGEESDEWHAGYGGGVWLNPFELGVLSLGYFTSEEDDRVSLRFGFFF